MGVWLGEHPGPIPALDSCVILSLSNQPLSLHFFFCYKNNCYGPQDTLGTKYAKKGTMWDMAVILLLRGKKLRCLNVGQGSIGRAGCSGGVLHPESGTSSSLSAISFLPCSIWSLSTGGEEPLWETLLQRAGAWPMSQAE